MDKSAATMNGSVQADLISNIELNEAALSACENLLKNSFWLSDGSTAESKSNAELDDIQVKSTSSDNEVEDISKLSIIIFFFK
jgi:hypothetical protein